MAEKIRPTVFVSYSHKDKKHLDSVLPFLEGLELNERIELWHDRLIGVGEDWYRQLEGEMHDAKVAILLVTQNFLASRFCKFEEIPVLLQRQREGRLAVLPVLLEPCLWEEEPWLKRLQMIPTDGPVPQRGVRRKQILTDLARKVVEVADKGVAPPEKALENWPPEAYNLRRLPQTGSLLFGRRNELALVDRAWNEGGTNLVVFTAGGGVGKSTLCRVWCEMLAEDDWRGAHRAFAWSFHSQGAGRQGSADTFVNAAFRWFGEDPTGLSPWDRGDRLAELVRGERMLLVLDGIEPLQSSSVADRGELRDPALKTLLENLAQENPGLCLVTTREPLTDLEQVTEPEVIHHDLDQVSLLAGRALLRVAGVKGSDKELESGVRELGRHALAVNLLATYIADTGGRHIGTLADLTPPDPSHGRDAHPRRVIEAWARRLGDSAELEVLNQLGLFDRPATGPELEALRQSPPTPGLNRHLQSADYSQTLARLRAVRLLAPPNLHEPETLDSHPLIREHLGESLHDTRPDSWKTGHNVLYEHLTSTSEYQPDGLEELSPLYAALTHGCAAGREREALNLVYFQRISRENESFVTHKLGAFAADLAGLASFFEVRWHKPLPTLPEDDQSWVLGQTGFNLRALGRLAAAPQPMLAALANEVRQENWLRAAAAAGNLAELETGRGELSSALDYATQGVEHADRSRLPEQQVMKRARLADVLFQLGRVEEAEALFREAERILTGGKPSPHKLYSLWGYLFCELLLEVGKVEEAETRALYALELVGRFDTPLLDQAVAHLSMGRLHLVQRDYPESKPFLRRAVELLRLAGQSDYLPRGLVANAEFHLGTADFERSHKVLDDSLTLCLRAGLRLFEADTWLGLGRLNLRTGELRQAGESLGRARAIIEQTGYGRRREELAELEAQLAD